ncbi:WD repeat-containing protein 26 homolog [Dioscorea cayenensis subsp. rotundata]|uniref:WD repeat-containing protein 26 homolog n=1 Tax=Dioscorea cayennensis subsp. rotundata TaxID=55577 RepID=A0AB40CJJ1_DIOCR|nr:WD repeat-containing protein 26 homolog [Dioscorea cayenensis subsp. rotundata]XP_039139713.1 WD repeat-containing protein 26 homolog [Dioscorea cayenensis subsp. rotundata]XP_039139714.1 WD repeat-containing protein 26 homolog [Dioscorea cayenensis subsp. rotundata]
MGGVDDNGPPLKRVKPASTELDNHSNNSFLSDPTIPLGGLMAKPLVSHGKNDTVGSKGIIKRVEFVRIITEALYSLGYARSGAILEEESGICLHSPVVSLFKQQVLDGNWDGSLATLHKIGLADENLMKSASFLILEKKFLELVENNKLVDALETLRNDISPLGINKKRVHELSGCLVYPSQFASTSFANSGTKAENPRLSLLVELQKLLPPTVLIPERRLENLVEQALNVQKETCSLHNSVENSFSLYSDHHCGKDQIPCQTTQILQDHCDEVWFLQFSNNGKYLASSSSDNSAIIWEVSEAGKVSLKHKLNGHKKPVLMVAWSPDDQQLLSCGVEEVICRWDVGSGQCLRVYEKSGFGLISCGWFPDGKRICSGVTDKSICMWDLDGKEIDCWKGLRATKTSDLAISRNGKWIISTCKEKTILLQDRDANLEKFIQEQQTITSFCLSRDDKFLLVNLINQEIHLWSIIDGPKLIAKYEGHKRSRFLIRSCFGGSEQSFIASGSEDSQVYIWHRETGELIWKLPGHGGAVNCVSWNPVNPHMMASASDDHTIRIWGLGTVNIKQKNIVSKDVVHQSNGHCK